MLHNVRSNKSIVQCIAYIFWNSKLSTFTFNLTKMKRWDSQGILNHISLHVLALWFLFVWFNPFPHTNASWRLCSRRIFENIVTKEEIAQNEQFLPLPQCFPLLVIGYPFNYRDFLLFDKICSKSSAAELSYEGKG